MWEIKKHEGNHRGSSIKKTQFTENEEKRQFCSSLFLSLCLFRDLYPSAFQKPHLPQHTYGLSHPLYPDFILFQGRATTNFPQKSLHLKYSSLFCSSVWGIAKLQVQVQLPTFERDSLYAFCTAFSMTGVVWKFYGFSSEECALELIKCAFVSACCAAWM